MIILRVRSNTVLPRRTQLKQHRGSEACSKDYLGMVPKRRTSYSVAWRRALAKALNVASTMWCEFFPASCIHRKMLTAVSTHQNINFCYGRNRNSDQRLSCLHFGETTENVPNTKTTGKMNIPDECEESFQMYSPWIGKSAQPTACRKTT